MDVLAASLRHLLLRARETIGADYAALGILDEQRLRLEHFITAGIDERVRRDIGAPPRGRGILGLLIAEPRALRLDDVAADPRSDGFPPGHPAMGAFLGVPVAIGGEAWGNLYFARRPGARSFDAADEQTALALSARAAAAVGNSRSSG